MNLPNLLSLSRVPALFIVGILLFIGQPTAAWVVFCLAALTDWADGYAARKTGQVSDFGKIMDALTDKILMVGIFTLFVTLELFPLWTVFILLIILTRELMVTGLRAIAAAQGAVLAAERGGKIKTATQMTCAVVALLGEALAGDFGLETVGIWLNYTGLGLFIVAGILTAQSGYVYMSKYAELTKS